MQWITLLFSFQGRLRRGNFWYASLLVLSAYVVLHTGLEAIAGRASTWILHLPLFWSLAAISVKRYHDQGRSGWWLALLAIPIIGPLWVLWALGFRKGEQAENRFGSIPDREELDYLTVADSDDDQLVVNDISGLNPSRVGRVVRPTTISELQKAIAESTGSISIGGGRFSMGGHCASSESLHVDMRRLNRVVLFSPEERMVRVQAGIRWCDLQRFLDPHDLSIKIMQTYANFTVGGSLNVNCHGRYVGLGPVILSVRSIELILADGTCRTASPTENSELFYGAIGGYGLLGVIAEATLDVVPNTRVKCVSKKMPIGEFSAHFRDAVRRDPKAVFHNSDIYPPHYSAVRSQTWVETDQPVTQTNRLMTLRPSFPLERYFFWAVSETPLGKWRREFVYDPILFFRQKVHWRNFEAGYDVAELEPASRARKTYVLQEYFVPVARFDEIMTKFAEILRRHQANVLNISIRHAIADPGSLLAWAREEVFALVLYYKQGCETHERAAVGVWTRELIDAALSVGGSYYLPYQHHATPEQFRKAYPRSNEFFALKTHVDPDLRFRNSFWEQYGRRPEGESANGPSEFRRIFFERRWSDAFYRFLQNIFHLHPEDQFHALIERKTRELESDDAIYRQVQAELPKITPLLAPLTHALPALKKQKREMARQTLSLLDGRKAFDGYVEIGSVGRYISELRKHVSIAGPCFIVNDVAPGNGPGDIMERGQFAKFGTFVPLDYQPLDGKGIAPASIDLITCFIGLHHAPDALLVEFVRSLHRVLRPGGLFVMRDHDVRTPEMATFVSLVHTVFNAGLGVPCGTNDKEFKHFASTDEWSKLLIAHGFEDLGPRLLQQNDPTDNTLMAFRKVDKKVTP